MGLVSNYLTFCSQRQVLKWCKSLKYMRYDYLVRNVLCYQRRVGRSRGFDYKKTQMK